MPGESTAAGVHLPTAQPQAGAAAHLHKIVRSISNSRTTWLVSSWAGVASQLAQQIPQAGANTMFIQSYWVLHREEQLHTQVEVDYAGFNLGC